MGAAEQRSSDESFVAFARVVEPKLRVALMARYGPTLGREAAAEAIAWAWEHWTRVQATRNPGGYVYRVGARRAQRAAVRRAVVRWGLDDHEDPTPWVEPGLPDALDRLSPRQRQAVVLVEGYGFTHDQVAGLLGVTRGTVQTHVERALAHLRDELGVTP